MVRTRYLAVLLLISVSACSHRETREPAEEKNQATAIPRQQIEPRDVDSPQVTAGKVVAVKVKRDEAATGVIRQAAQKAVSNDKIELASIRESDISSYPQPALMLQRHAAEPTDRENFLHYEENSIKSVRENPVSTFSIDVDTASYSNIRRIIMRDGRLPRSDAVRLEEMINYFSYDYKTPETIQQPFSVSVEMAPTPWNRQHQLLQIGLKGFEPQSDERPGANLVFLVDVSGSMRSEDKLALVKKSLQLLVDQMDSRDSIALVVYAGSAGMVLDSTPGNQKAKIRSAIQSLEAGGSTNGGAGIRLAYSLAQQHYIDGGINRVIIASDGDMNVGTVNIEALKDLIKARRKTGIALTTLGFGTGNYNYALMEQLADVGDGNAAYIDSLKEAQKVLVEEMQSTLLTIARDVKIQIEFNPNKISEYRLLGYENRLLNREDFRNDKIDAGDIGAGHTVTALYEVVLAGNSAEDLPQSRYTKETKPVSNHSDELAYVRLRYKKPGSNVSTEFSKPVLTDHIEQNIELASDNLRFASAVAGFGQILRGGKYTHSLNYDDVLNLARDARGRDEHGYRGELISLVELAKSLSNQQGD